MTDFTKEFLVYMNDRGFSPKGNNLIADDKWHQAKVTGDKGNKLSGAYCMKIVDADFAIGCCFSRKDPDTKHKWHAKNGEKLTPAERKELNKQIKLRQKLKEDAEKKIQLKIASRLTKYCKSLPKATDHPYLKNKGILPHNVKYRAKTNELVMPCKSTDGKVWTIQKINARGGKFLFAGGRKKGSYYSFAKKGDDMSMILVAEGFSTAASIREATGMVTISAIDSGNLKPVLISLKKKYPDTRFIICADNDQFTFKHKLKPKDIDTSTIRGDDARWLEWKDRGIIWNVGIEKAEQAAVAIGGATVVFPTFKELGTKPTDFNDLHKLEGLEEISAQIKTVTDKIPVKQEAIGVEETSNPYQQYSDGDNNSEPDGYINYEEQALIKGDFGMDFKVLGYNKGVYYYFPFTERQIVALTASAHTLPNLFRLDNLDNWHNKFGGEEISERKIVTYATNALMQLSKRREVFKEEDKVRGSGAWIDKGKKVLNCGNRLFVDGRDIAYDQFQSGFTYVASTKIASPKNPLTSRETYALREICESVTWENKLSGSLLAGWLVIAPVCGALGFRPHIYITGEAESGKSTVMDKIIKPTLGKMSINVDGGTTEPAIREMMEHDARPIVYDEAENKESSMAAVISLARKASTGGTVKKFGQGMMKVRFCACFSAINPPVNKTADESRISFMSIKKNKRPTAIQEYEDLLDKIEATITPEFSDRMLARTLANIDVLFENIKVFQKAARLVIKGARASQVIGTMIAGLYLLSKTDVISLEDAKVWVAQYDWKDHTMINDDTDPIRLLQYLSGCLIKNSSSGLSKDITIGNLIISAQRDPGLDKVLRNYGIAVKDNKVFIAGRCAPLQRLLNNTDWGVKWAPMLANIEGAEKFNSFYFGAGFKTSGVSIPFSLFEENEGDQTEMEISF